MKDICVKFDRDEHNYLKDIQLTSDAATLWEVFAKMEAPMTSGADTDPHAQYEKIMEIQSHIEGTGQVMVDVTDKSIAKRAVVFRQYQLKLIEKIMLLKWEPYVEKYFFLVSDLYHFHEPTTAQGGPGEWVWEVAQTNKHPNVMEQKKPVTNAGAQGTIAQLKFKHWFNFHMHFAIKLITPGEAGIVFRFADFFNYYYFTISDKGQKLGRFVKGIDEVIQENADIKYDMDAWHRFWIVVERFDIKIYNYKEMNPLEPPLDLKTVKLSGASMTGEDQVIPSGFMGLIT